MSNVLKLDIEVIYNLSSYNESYLKHDFDIILLT